MDDLCEGTSNHIGFFIFICIFHVPFMRHIDHTMNVMHRHRHTYIHLPRQVLSSSSLLLPHFSVYYSNVNKRKYKPMIFFFGLMFFRSFARSFIHSWKVAFDMRCHRNKRDILWLFLSESVSSAYVYIVNIQMYMWTEPHQRWQLKQIKQRNGKHTHTVKRTEWYKIQKSTENSSAQTKRWWRWHKSEEMMRSHHEYFKWSHHMTFSSSTFKSWAIRRHVNKQQYTYTYRTQQH